MLIGHGGQAQEDEDDGLGAGAEHLEEVDHRGPRVLTDVPLHVLLHRDAAEHDAENGKDRMRASCPARRILLEVQK